MNQASKLLCIAVGLAALTLIGNYTAKPLWAQIKAALVENIDEPGRNPYQSTIQPVCVNMRECIASFAAVPPGKRLVVTSLIGMLLPGAPGGVVADLTLFKNGQPFESGIAIPTTLEAGTLSGIDNLVGVDAQFTAYFEPADTPAVHVFATNNFGFGAGTLTLSGYLVTLP